MFRTSSPSPSTTRREPSPDLTLATTIGLPSRVDVHAVAAIADEIGEALHAGAVSIVLDATSVKHLDHAGIDALCSLRSTIEAEQRLLQIVASSTLRIAVELTGSNLLTLSEPQVSSPVVDSELVAA